MHAAIYAVLSAGQAERVLAALEAAVREPITIDVEGHAVDDEPTRPMSLSQEIGAVLLDAAAAP